MKDLLFFHRLIVSGDKVGHGELLDLHPTPSLVVIARLCPSRFFLTGIDGLAVVDLSASYFTRGGFPASVRNDSGRAAILIPDDQLQQQRDILAIEILLSGEPYKPSVPAVGKRHAQRILPAAQELRDVIDLVLQPLVVRGPTGCQKAIPDAAAIELCLI